MTQLSSSQHPTLGNVLRAGVPALALGLLVAFALRSTALPVGARLAMSFVVFAAVDTILYARITGLTRSPGQWVTTVAVWMLAALGMWIVAEY